MVYITWGKKPPLMLLQENTNRITKAKKVRQNIEIIETASDITKSIEVNIHELKLPETKKYGAIRHVLRYVVRHTRRAMVKSLLVLMVALLLSGAMGQFTSVRQSYSEIYHNIIIKARFIKGISYDKAQMIAESGYVNSPYYEFNKNSEISFEDTVYEPVLLCLTNDVEESF